MNMQEFAALKVGDKVDNHMSQSQGVVAEITAAGVRVRWGDGTPGSTISFMYSVNTTSWTHWSRVVEGGAS